MPHLMQLRSGLPQYAHRVHQELPVLQHTELSMSLALYGSLSFFL